MSARPLRVAVVGLGDIAAKAWLPVLAATAGVAIVPCSRDAARRAALAAQYRLPAGVDTVDALADESLDAAFVHVATSAHEAVVGALLERGLPVFVDKPLADHLPACERLAELARTKGVPLMVGFNRRFAPRVRAMAGVDGRTHVRLDKHRAAQPDAVRRVVFDDFIHVVDTLRFLAPGAVRDIGIHGAVDGAGRLLQVSLQLEGAGFRLEGTMHRDAGAAEEWLEVIAPGHTWRIEGLSTLMHGQGGQWVRHAFGDWEPVLWRRGFPQMAAHFLAAVRGEAPLASSLDDMLATHALCERIVQRLAPDPIA
jgi:virulence factor